MKWLIHDENNASAERGAGVVMGYIDGFKLPNKEQVFPRLPGADAAGGPTIQANMVDQRIPIRQSPFITAPLARQRPLTLDSLHLAIMYI